MTIKFSLPDKNTDAKKMVASSGAYHSSSSQSKMRYASSQSISVPITKNAQWAGSAANVTFTQPMFFSPLHTPQNWQIASKRREVYQWSRFYYENEPKVAAGVDFYCFEPSTPILMADGEQKAISSLRIGDIVRSHDGTSNEISKVHMRDADENMLKIKIAGVSQGSLRVTLLHGLFVMRNNKLQEIPAKELQQGDWLVSPCHYEENKNSTIDFDDDFAWLLGIYAAEGCGIPYEHISKKSKIEKHYKGVYFTLSIDEYETLAKKIELVVNKLYGTGKVSIRIIPDRNTTKVSVYSRDIADDLCGLCPGIAKDSSKRFSPIILKSSINNLRSILTGFMDGDGCFNKNNGFQGVGVSKKLSEQVANMCDRLGLAYSFTKTRIFKWNRQVCYNVRISRRSCWSLNKSAKYYDHEVDNNYCRNTPYLVKDNYLLRKIISIKQYRYSGKVYDLTVENSHTYIANRISCHNSQFPMNGFRLECKSKKVLKFFEKITKDLRLNHWLKLISHEYYLLGDVFPFLEIDCPECGGSGINRDGEICNHPNGKIKRIVVLNPDWIEVQQNVVASEPLIALVPDEELRLIVSRKQPRQIYDRLPPKLVEMVSTGQPIPLSNRCVSHLKHNASPYGTYGTSMLRRLFTMLAYKTKLITANWIVAERLILPVRVVKVGDKDRPANADDIADVSNQLSAVANDPNLTIVTHHAFDYEWYGACYDDKTQVFTNKGLMSYKEAIIHEDIEIMVFDPKSGNARYEKPLAFHEYDYDNFMVRLSGNKVDMMVTPNHTMLGYKRDKKTAYSMQAKDFIKINESNRYTRSIADYSSKNNDPEYVDVCGYKVPMDDFMKFAGYYISEGYCEYKPNKRRYIVSVSQSPYVNQEYCDDIDNCVNNLGIDFSKYEYDGRATSWNILNKDIAKQFSEWFGSGSSTKKIPDFIKNLSKGKLEILLDSYINGDASRYYYNNSYSVQLCTNSKKLSYDLLEILFKTGRSPIRSNFKKKNTKQYMVYCNMDGNGKGQFPRIKQDQISAEYYNGKVWCFETSTGFFVTERNGKISIQGNTGKIHSITNELEQIGKEVLDGLMLNQSLLNGEMGAYCHSEDTLTLTDSGFKRYDEISKRDKVACYNPDTKRMEYHQYKEKYVYDYDGEMINFKTNKIDIKVTPNHRMWIQSRGKKDFNFIEAKDVKLRSKLVQSVDGFDGEYQPEITIGDETYSIYDFCEMIGFYVSEGSISEEKRINRKNGITTLNMHQSINGKARKSVSNLYDRMFDIGYKSENTVYVYKPKLAKYLSDNCGRHSYYKKLPQFIKNLSSECLEVVLKAMLDGDSTYNLSDDGRKNGHYRYYTSSDQLAKDVEEIAFKCGYTTSISYQSVKKQSNKIKKYYNKSGFEHKSKKGRWIICISKNFKGKYPTLQSKKKEFVGKEITKEHYKGKVYCFSVPYGLFVTKRNDKITIQGNSSAQVGVETMIRRLENWRNTLAEWVENHIFIPIAMMQGFVDDDESKIIGETMYLYPSIKWNDLNLRDKTNHYQTIMQLHDKQLISSRTLLEEFDLDYDQEVQRLREEIAIAGPQGQLGAGGAGGMPLGGGMPPLGGGMPGAEMGGMPGADMGGAMPGAEMGGMPGADMGGAMPGAGAPPMGAAANLQPGLKIGKKGKGGKNLDDQMKPPPPKFIKLTKLEQSMYKALQGLDIPYQLFGQYQVPIPGNQQPFILDFAYPSIGVGIETDGEIWHESIDNKIRDQERDNKLANVGWRILRFKQSAIEEKLDDVRKVIYQNIVDASREKAERLKKSEENTELIKEASIDNMFNSLNDVNIKYKKEFLDNDLGVIYLIGT